MPADDPAIQRVVCSLGYDAVGYRVYMRAVGGAMAWTSKLRPAAMVAVLSFCSSASADTDYYAGASPLTDSQWDMVRDRVGLLDKIAYLPSLLPVIMKHRDKLELTDEQIAAFRQWRKLHYQDMVDLMNKIIQAVKTFPESHVEIAGHTDSTGSASVNRNLSRARAANVARFLVEVGGIPASQVTATGYGEERPVASNETAAGRAANRRVEVLIINQ